MHMCCVCVCRVYLCMCRMCVCVESVESVCCRENQKLTILLSLSLVRVCVCVFVQWTIRGLVCG